MLPATYTGEHVDHGYARTVDTAQGATVDHSLFAPSASTSAERAYVALSRGRHSNRIYATTDRSWVDAIRNPRSHTFATDQHPDPSRHAGLDIQRPPGDLIAHHAAVRTAARHRTADRRERPDRPRQPARWLVDPHGHERDDTNPDLEQHHDDRQARHPTLDLGL